MKNSYTIKTDGGSRGNPGPAAIGVIIEGPVNKEKAASPKAGEPRQRREYGEYIGIKTNNEAEYQAVIFGLKKLKQLIGNEQASISDVIFVMDSELLVKQFNNEFKIKEEKMQKLFLEVHNLRLDFSKVQFKHVLRGKNTHADELVNQILDREESKLNL